MKSGLVLAERYSLDARAAIDLPSTETWLATDVRLGTSVTVLLVTADDARGVKEAADGARTIRDARLARIVEVGLFDQDEGADSARPYVVLERPKGLAVSDLLTRRVLPVEVARALVGEAAAALATAAHRGLRNGAALADLLTITTRGRVVLAGAGVTAALVPKAHGGRGITERDDALALALLFVRAITPGDGDEFELDDLPDGLSTAERGLAFVLSGGNARPALADVTRALGAWDPSLLTNLDQDAWRFPRRGWVEVVPEVGAATTIEEIPVVDGGGTRVAAPVDTVEELDEYGEPLEDLDDEWGFDALETLPPEELPGVGDAVLALIARKFPVLEPGTRRLQRARAWAHARPEVPVSVLMVGGFAAILLTAFLAYRWMQVPYVPDFDLNNAPPQHYPEFTFGPSPTPSPTSSLAPSLAP